MRLMLIITGTGRCGTATMARLFGGYHEFRAEYLLEKYFRPLDPWKRAFRSRDERLAPMLDLLQCVDRSRFVDSSNLYIHFLDVLPVLDPDVRIVLVVRDVVGFTRSALRRGWHERQEYGMVPPDGDPCRGAWEGLSAAERGAWIWQFRNGCALEGLRGLPRDTWTIVRIEDLSRSDTVAALERFSGRVADRAVAGKAFNAGARGGTEKENGFLFSDRARALAAPLMKRLGYADKALTEQGGK